VSFGLSFFIFSRPCRPTPLLYYSSSIIQDIIPLRDAGKASLAYFYFDFRDVDKQKLHNLLPSLLIQLSYWSNPRYDILSRLYSAHGYGIHKPTNRAMVKCLKEMLTLEAQGPTYIIMDALDECPITSTIPSREDVIELVEELVGLHIPNLHICVSSRPEHDIQVVLERLTEHPVSLHDESGQQEDIAKYVASLFVPTRGCSDGGRRTRILLSRRCQKRRMECKGVAICFHANVET
jgi:hypothetical protein